MNPNKAFKAKNNKFIVPDIRLIYSFDRHLKMRCRSCLEPVSLHIKAHSSFRPASVTCECGSNDWIWGLK